MNGALSRLRVLRLSLAAGLATVVLLPAVPTSAAAAAAVPVAPVATLTVVHGLRGLVADVKLDGGLVLAGFAPERVSDELPVTAGRHRVQVWPSSATLTPPIIDEVVTVAAGEQVTLGVGLDAQGKAGVSVFHDENLLSSRGTALVVRGLASGEPVRFDAGRRTVSASLSSGQTGVAALAPGSYAVSVISIGRAGKVLLPAQDVPVPAGRATVLYLIGSQRDATLGLVAQTVRPVTLRGAPLRVETGVGPMPVDQGPQSGSLLALLTAVSVAATAAVVRVRRWPRR